MSKKTKKTAEKEMSQVEEMNPAILGPEGNVDQDEEMIPINMAPEEKAGSGEITQLADVVEGTIRASADKHGVNREGLSPIAADRTQEEWEAYEKEEYERQSKKHIAAWTKTATAALSNKGGQLTLIDEPSGGHPFMSSTLAMAVPHGVVVVRRLALDSYGASAFAEETVFCPGARIQDGKLVP